MQLQLFINISLLLIATPIAFFVCLYAGKTIVVGVLDYVFPSESVQVVIKGQHGEDQAVLRVENAKDLANIINTGSLNDNGQK